MNETPETALAPQDAAPASPAPQTAYAPTIWNDPALMKTAYGAAKYLAASDLVPEATYKNKPANCLIAVDMANRMNVSPLLVMQNLYIVKGHPAWSGSFCIAAINGCGKFSPLEFVTVETGGGGCFARATRKDTGEVCKGATITMQMAADEGWLSKSGSKWKTFPEQMLRYRAASFFARAFCPEVLVGIQTVEEVQDVRGYDAPEQETVTITLE